MISREPRYVGFEDGQDEIVEMVVWLQFVMLHLNHSIRQMVVIDDVQVVSEQLAEHPTSVASCKIVVQFKVSVLIDIPNFGDFFV